MNIYHAIHRLLRRLLVISLFWLAAIPATTATDGNDAESFYRRVSSGLDRLQERAPSITWTITQIVDYNINPKARWI